MAHKHEPTDGVGATELPTPKPTLLPRSATSGHLSSNGPPNLPPLDLRHSVRSVHDHSSAREQYRIDAQALEHADGREQVVAPSTPSSDRTVMNEGGFGTTTGELAERDRLSSRQRDESHALHSTSEDSPTHSTDRPKSRTVTTVTRTETVRQVFSAAGSTGADRDDDEEGVDRMTTDLNTRAETHASAAAKRPQSSSPTNRLRNRHWGLSFCHNVTPRKIRPKPSVVVWIKYKIFNVLWVDTVSQSFRARFSLEATWEDPSLNGCGPDSTRVQNAWHPRRLSLVNEIESEYSPNFELCSWEKNPSNNAVMTCYFNCSASFITKMNLRMFPFDSQDLKISFTMHSRDRDVEFALNPFRPSAFDAESFMLHEWVPMFTHSSCQVNAESNLPVFHIQCRLRRQSGFYLTNVALPVFLITVLTWLGYAIPAGNTGSRLEAILTLVLTSVAFKFVVAGHLPPLSYNTLCDYYVLWSLLFQVAVAVQIGLTPMLIAPASHAAQVGNGHGNHNSTLSDAAAQGGANAMMQQEYLARLEAFDRIFASLSFGLYVLMHVVFLVVIKLHRKQERRSFPGADTWQEGGRKALGRTHTLGQVMPTK